MCMKKNDRLIGVCESYTYEGLGVVKNDGFPIFVKDMLIGEKGEIVITKVLKNYAFGRCLNRLETSDQRVEPICPIYKQCGGCQIQHLSVQAQKEFKTQRVQDCITRIGKLDLQVEPCLTMEQPSHYRNKGQVPVGVKDNQVICGFYRFHSNDIIDMNACLIQHDAINETVSKIKSLLNIYQNGEYFRHLLIKVGFKTNEIMVVLIVRDENVPYLDEMVEAIQEDERVKSIILNLNQRNDNVILGDKEILLAGKPTIQDELDGLKFNISSKSFYQVNPIQTEVLYSKVCEFAQLNHNETVLDLYCGIGTISLFMARYAKHVTGIEIVPEAIEDAKINAQLNGIENVEFVCSDSAAYAEELAKNNTKLDVICVDPPRKGCDETALASMVTMSPERIVYVSCDPATLARDLRYLSDYGYEVKVVQPVDMFPGSFHVECVTLIVKK